MSRIKSYCHAIQLLPQAIIAGGVDLKSNKHKARIESGTGRDGANGFAFGEFSASSYERYANDKERKFQL